MKIVVVTAMWKRPKVFSVFAQSMKDLGLEVCVAGSEGEKSEKLAKKYGCHYVEVKNHPLGQKMNAASRLAESTDGTHFLMMGSDDILNEKMLEVYKKNATRYEYVCVLDGYFYDTVSKESLYWGGYREHYRRNHPLGCGRLLTRHQMQRAKWELWHNGKLHDLLDTAFDQKVRVHPRKTGKLRMEKYEGAAILDIKTATNMTPFADWDNTVRIDSDSLLSYFPDKIVKMIKKI